MTPTTITGQAEVSAVLADPAYQVPPAPPVPDSAVGTLGWLRWSVARFSEGAVHSRRRAMAESDLAGMDPRALRQEAAATAAADLADRGRGPFDGMDLFRRVPLAVLAARLGMIKAAEPSCELVSAAIIAAAGYLTPDQAGQDADAAVSVMIKALRDANSEAGPEPELSANRIALLMQACDATAGLIGNAIALATSSPATGSPAGTTDDLLARTLTVDPPVLRTRRLAPDGNIVLVDLTAHPFGTGRRPCPGSDQAVALAAGVLDAVLPACELADPIVTYPETGNLRVPVSLRLRLR